MSIVTQAKAKLKPMPQPLQPMSPVLKVAQGVTGAPSPAKAPGAPIAAPTGAAPVTMQPPATPQMPAAPTMPTVPPVPVPPPVGGVPPVAGAAISPIKPANDLRFSAITPDGSGPDRTALAQQKFKDLMAGQADEHRLGVEQIGRDAAKFGRIGMGGVATSVGNLGDVFKRRELEAANSLASSVADGDITDSANQRNELRGERDYQYGAGRDAQDDRVRQTLLEEQLLNGGFGRAATMTQLGYQGNPSGVQSATAGSYADDATGAFDNVGELMRIMAARKAKAGTAPVGAASGSPAPSVGNSWDY